MKRGRKEGTGKVVVDGRVLTQKDYRNSVIEMLQRFGNNWTTANTLVNAAADNHLVEKKSAPRRADRHPLWRVLTSMVREENPVIMRKKNSRGLYVYRLTMPEALNINAERYELQADSDDTFVMVGDVDE